MIKMLRDRGFVIFYSIVLLMIVSVMIVIVLTAAQATSYQSVTYQEYLARKSDLDEIGGAAIDYYRNEKIGENWTADFPEYLITEEVSDSTVTVYVSRSDKILLYLQFTQAENAYDLEQYIYTYGR